MAEEEKDFSPDGEDAGREEIAEEEDLESIREALKEEREKAEKYLANWQRAEADLINFKKRSDQERAELATFANTTLVINLLPVIDDLERALENVPDELAKNNWINGITLIYRKLQAVLQAQGLTLIECEDAEFDPNFHEAVMCVEGEDGKIIEELQKGYTFCNRVIRPTMVKVGKSKESAEQEG